MRHFFVRSLLGLCLATGSAFPAHAQSLLDAEWMAASPSAAVQALLNQGANLKARDLFGRTPLHLASGFNKTPAVTALLLDRGAEVNTRDQLGRTPLHLAAASNPIPAVTALLLDRGADLHGTEQGRRDAPAPGGSVQPHPGGDRSAAGSRR